MRCSLLIAGIITLCLGACGDGVNEPKSQAAVETDRPAQGAASSPTSKVDSRKPNLSFQAAQSKLGIELPKDATISRTIELGTQMPKGLSVAMHFQRHLGEAENFFRTRLDPQVGKRFLPMQRERWATRNMMGKQYRLAEYEERESPWKLVLSILSEAGRETVQINVQRLRTDASSPTSRPR